MEYKSNNVFHFYHDNCCLNVTRNHLICWRHCSFDLYAVTSFFFVMLIILSPIQQIKGRKEKKNDKKSFMDFLFLSFLLPFIYSIYLWICFWIPFSIFLLGFYCCDDRNQLISETQSIEQFHSWHVFEHQWSVGYIE